MDCAGPLLIVIGLLLTALGPLVCSIDANSLLLFFTISKYELMLGGYEKMKTIELIIVMTVFMAVITWASLHNDQATASEGPTTEFIMAALQNQEAACGKSLEVRYKYWQAGYEQDVFDVRYVRTPEMLFIERANGSQVMSNSFDKTRNEFRELLTTPAGTKTGSIDDQLSGILNTQGPMDTVRRPLDTGTLLDVIRRGSIAASKEQIGSYSCWRIDALATGDTGAASYVVWIDSEIDFCPRRIEIHWKNQSKTQKTIDFKNYQDVGNGVWFPMEISLRTTQAADERLPSQLTGDLEFISKVEEIHIDNVFTKDELTVQFPSGTEVMDNLRNAVYRVP